MPAELRDSPVSVVMPPFGISAFRSQHAANFRMARRRDPFDKMIVVESGLGNLQVAPGQQGDEFEVPLRPGVAIWIHANVLHRFVDDPDQPMTLDVVCLKSDVLLETPSIRPLWETVNSKCGVGMPRHIMNPYRVDRFRRLFRDLIVELGRDLPYRSSAAVAIAIQLLVLLARDSGTRSRHTNPEFSAEFVASIAYLEDHFTEPLRVDLLAGIAGMSYRSYTKRFKQFKGMTTTQYWNLLKIELAKQRLLTTRNILGSAFDAGFQDLSHFYRTFKRLVGVTPTAFIARPFGEKS